MATETIGLRAVFDLGQLNSGIAQYTSSIISITKITGNAANTLQGQFVGMGQGILKFGAIAGGVAVGGVAALSAGIVALGFSALNEVAKFERMSLSISNLVAREISGGQVIEQARQTRIQLSEKEAKELEKLPGLIEREILSRNTLAARIQEQKQRIIELTAAYGENGLNVQTAKARLAEMEGELGRTDSSIAGMQTRIEGLNSKQGQLVTTLEKVRVGQISMAEAMKQATPRAQELIKWIELLAIQSPFTSEGIQNAFQTALAYGFTTEQAQRLTEAMVDFTAATGKTAQSADLIALALGQIQARGKLSAQELRQLSEQGIGTNRILEDMGFSLDDVTNGLVPVDKFMEAVIKDMEVFKGAAAKQATTFSGLMSSLGEIKSVGLREFFTGTFEAIRPYLSDFVNFLTTAAFQTGSIRDLGDVLGQYVGSALANIAEFSRVIQAGGLATFSTYLGTDGIPLWYELKELIGNISGSLSGLGQIISSNLSGPMGDFTGNIIPAITQGLSFINQNFEAFKGALVGVGVVIGGAVFAALVAGILSLLTPINLIIAGAALLGAAWAGNWGDIQGKTMAVWAVVQPVLQQVYDWLQVQIPLAIQTMSTFWTNTLQPAMMTVWSWTSSNLLPLFMSINNLLSVTLLKTLTAFAGLWQNILWPALNKVWSLIQNNLLPVFTAIGEKAGGDIIPPLKTLGEEILPMLSDGLETVTEWIKKATDFFNGLADAVSSFSLPDVLTPGSPPPMAYALMDIAKASGIAKGSIDALTQGVSNSSKTFAVMMTNTVGLQSQLAKALVPRGQRQDLTHLAQNLLPQFAGTFEAGQFGTGTLLQGIGQGLKAIGSKVGIGQVVDALKRAGYSLENVTNQMNAAFTETQKLIRLQNASKAVGVAGQLAQFGQTAADRLASRIETLQAIVNSGAEGAFQGQIISATMAQDELNRALEEQAAVQQQIVDLQRQQADLQFLQQQISLIQMIKDAGLDVKDILGGITLGLDASLPDIVTAMNNVVQAMINQIDSDLQIQSPSKVMFDKFKQVGLGAAKGIMSTKGLLERAFAPVVQPLLSAGPSVASVTNNSYYDFNMTVNTGASPQGVIGQYEVMRGLIGA